MQHLWPYGLDTKFFGGCSLHRNLEFGGIWNPCVVSSSGQVWASVLFSNLRLAQSKELLTKTGSSIQRRRAQEKQNSVCSTSDKDLLNYNKHSYYIKPSLQKQLTPPHHKVDC